MGRFFHASRNPWSAATGSIASGRVRVLLPVGARPLRCPFFYQNQNSFLKQLEVQVLKSVATEICARRLGVAQGRAAALIQMASNAGILPKACGSSRPDLTADELTLLFLSIAVDNGMGNVGRTVPAYANLTTPDGVTLADAITHIIADTPTARAAAQGALIIHLDLPRATLLAAGEHHVFGADEPHGKAGRHVAIPGAALAALALELQGARPETADEIVGITSRPA